MQNAIQFLANSNIWIALCVAAWLHQSYILLGKSLGLPDIALIVFAAASTYLVYHLHRIISSVSHRNESLSSRHIFFLNHKKYVVASLVIALMTVVGCLFFLKKESIMLLLVLGLISLTYSVPFYKNYRLRDFGLLKPFWVAFVWATLAVYVPFYEDTNAFSNKLYLLWFNRFLFIAAITIPFDVRDMAFDQNKIKFPTLPLKIGIKKTYYIAFTLFIFSLLPLILFLFHHQHSVLFYKAVFTTYLLVGFIIVQIFKEKHRNNPYAYTFYLDGTILILSFIFLIFQFFD